MPPNRLNSRAMGGNTAHRILLSPELLDMIFKYMNNKNLASAARVCRLWSPIALDVLWREIEDLTVLLQLLAPLTHRDNENGMRFERPPDPNGWRRFNTHAKRVRKLIYLTRGKPPIHQSAFDELARTRTRVDILPNLQDLIWSAENASASVIFMHERVKAFAFSLHDRIRHEGSLTPYFEEIIFRMPNLTTLDIRSGLRAKDYQNDIGKLLTSLPKLKKVVFPRFYVTTHLAEVMSRLENLEVLEFQYHDEQGCGYTQDVWDFNPTLSEGAFPALWDLSLTISFQHATKLLSGPFAPSNITMLHLDSDMTESAQCTHDLLTAISNTCQNLTYLGLSSFQERIADGSIEGPTAVIATLTIETLTPLFKLPNLTNLEIKHSYPISLTIQDLERIASHWPMLETFVLNDEPTTLETSNLTLEALLPFARHCPRLTHLGLFVDANAHCPSLDPESPTYDPTKVPVFPSLRLLTVGVSPIEQDERPTLYLSQMLPQKCEVESGVTWNTTVMIPGGDRASELIRDRCEMWDNVGKLLPMMIRLRAEERMRTRVMERELVQLKTKTGVIRELASE